MQQVPSADTWRRLHAASEKFRALEPWKTLEDYAAFAVKDPASEELGFARVLGKPGPLTGLVLYRGPRGLDFYQQTEDGEIAPEFDDEVILEDSIRLEFYPRAGLEAHDLDVLNAIDIKPGRTGSYPRCRSYLPGYVPAQISEREARWLIFALESAVDYVESVRDDEALLQERYFDAFLTYFGLKPGGHEYDVQWVGVDPYLPPVNGDVPVNEFAVRKIQAAKMTADTAWEAGVVINRAGIINEGPRAWYSRRTLIVQKQSSQVFKMVSLHPEADAGLKLRDQLLEAIEKNKLMPVELHVTSDTLWESLRPVTERLGIRLRMKRFLPAVAEVREKVLQGTDLTLSEKPADRPEPSTELH